jgi:PAS domain S-box-containing protein
MKWWPQAGSTSTPLKTVAVLFAMLLALGWSTYHEFQKQRSSPTDSAQWSIFQTSLEFNRLNNAYGQFRLAPDAETRAELSKRFDIFVSRVDILTKSNAFDNYRGLSYFDQTIGSLRDFTQRMADLIDRGDFDRLRSDTRIESDFQEIGRSLATFVASAVQTQASWDVASRDRLKQLLLAQLIIVSLVLIAVVYFAFAVMQQRNQAIAREEESNARKELLRATVNSSLDGVVIADARGDIVEVNEAAAQMFGHMASDMEGKEMSALIVPPRMRAAHQEGMSRFISTGNAKVMGRRIELAALRSDGSEFPVEISIAATGGGSATKFVAFMRDISERRLSERSLQAAKERAESASREKAQFLAAISHEMRTPLTGILGSLELISDSRLSETQLKHVQTANRCGHALLSVISDVLDISRLEANKVELDLAPLDLHQIVDDVLEIVGKLAADRGNSIRSHMASTIPAHLSGDTARIRQVLLNLTSNAAKFTQNGTIEIEISDRGRDDDDAIVEFTVRDTGPGIPQRDKEKLFKSFSQLSNGAQNPVGGSGLGLAISSRLVALMSGSIGVESEEGKGSTFWFRLPLKIAADRIEAPEKAPDKLGPAPGSAPMTVLIVDDNETVRSVIAGQLAAREFLAETADGALTALRMLTSAQYDAVILDISMPGMDGFEALKEIRKLPGLAHRMPVIALTAHALVEDRERCLAAGFDQFLTKPVRSDELSRVIALAVAADAGAAPATRNDQDSARTNELFDLSGLREQFVSVSPQDLLRIVERYGLELEQQLALLESEGEEMSPYHYRRIVHVLSGSSAMIGARSLAALAREMDTKNNEAKDVEAISRLAELIALIQETQTAVAAAKQRLRAEVAHAAVSS